MTIKGIKWIGICTTDWNRTISFYRDVLGLRLRSEETLSTVEGQGVRCAQLATASGDFIEAFDQSLPERDLFHTPVVGFVVDDVASARAELEGEGVNFIGPVGAEIGNGRTSALPKGMCIKSCPNYAADRHPDRLADILPSYLL